MSTDTAKEPLNLARIAALSSTGVIMGLLTALVGLPPPVEPLLWVLAYSAWVVLVLARAEPRPLATMVLAGGITGLLTGSIQIALLPAYLEANPQWAGEIAGRTRAEMIPNFVGFGITMGLLFGVIFGLVAYALFRRRGGRS